MERQRFLALHYGKSNRDVAVNGYIQSSDRFYWLKHPVSLGCSLENELKCGCLGGCRGNVACFLPIKAANSEFMDVCDYSPIGLPKMQVQKSLTLR